MVAVSVLSSPPPHQKKQSQEAEFIKKKKSKSDHFVFVCFCEQQYDPCCTRSPSLSLFFFLLNLDDVTHRNCGGWQGGGSSDNGKPVFVLKIRHQIGAVDLDGVGGLPRGLDVADPLDEVRPGVVLFFFAYLQERLDLVLAARADALTQGGLLNVRGWLCRVGERTLAQAERPVTSSTCVCTASRKTNENKIL